VEAISITTPDGCVIDGVIAGRHDAARMNSAIVYLGGNGEYYEFRADLLDDFAASPHMVVLFNYRGVSASTGRVIRHGAVIDVCSVVAFLIHQVQVPADRIILLGHSIGGTYAAEAAVCMPGPMCINDRSFGRVSATAVFHVAPRAASGRFADTTTAKLVRWVIRLFIANVALWELDTVQHWRRLPASSKLIVYSQYDRVIPWPSQLLALLMTSAPASAASDIGCRMALDVPHDGDISNEHNRLMTASEKRRMLAAITCFLQRRPLPDTV
jgi:pimeloyl-ACP methyl ester carboxylesterase